MMRLCHTHLLGCSLTMLSVTSGSCYRQRFSKNLKDGYAENVSVETDIASTKQCFCKRVRDEKACNTTKHGKGLDEIRLFQASPLGGGKCCKFATSRGKAGQNYHKELDDGMCTRLPKNSCCHTPLGISFYIKQLSKSVLRGRGVVATATHAQGATLNGQLVPRYLLYKFVYDQFGDEHKCDSLEFHAETCELGVAADTFEVKQAERNTCCRNDEYGLSFYVSEFHRIKGFYRNQWFIARRHITGAIVDGQLFPAQTIQKYLQFLPQHWAGNTHYGPDWPYGCDEATVTDSCELTASQKDSKRAPWHKIRVVNWQRQNENPPVCCGEIGRSKFSVLVNATFIAPHFDDNEKRPEPFTGLEYVVGTTLDGKRVAAKETVKIIKKYVHAAKVGLGYHGLVCKVKSAVACNLNEAARPDGV